MDDLTKLGHVPKKQGKKPTQRLAIFHCVDHTTFRESCHNCLVIAVGALLVRVDKLEADAHVHTENTIPWSIRRPD